MIASAMAERRPAKRRKAVDWSHFASSEPRPALPVLPDRDALVSYIYCVCKGAEVRADQCTRCQY